jgi:hypothetical protein
VASAEVCAALGTVSRGKRPHHIMLIGTSGRVRHYATTPGLQHHSGGNVTTDA